MRSSYSVSTYVRTATLAAAILLGGCAALEPGPQEMTWTGVSHGVSLDAATGKFTRGGVALFKNGDAAVMHFDGQMTSRDGSTFNVRISYKFEDGSTFVHEGQGRGFERDGKRVFEGAGAFTSGTGRFAGISGKTSSQSRNLSNVEQVGEYKAEYTIPRK